MVVENFDLVRLVVIEEFDLVGNIAGVDTVKVGMERKGQVGKGMMGMVGLDKLLVVSVADQLVVSLPEYLVLLVSVVLLVLEQLQFYISNQVDHLNETFQFLSLKEHPMLHSILLQIISEHFGPDQNQNEERFRLMNRKSQLFLDFYHRE
jgi:hypothetical protein